MSTPDDPRALLARALADRRAWLVGGAVRDRVLRTTAAAPRRAAPVADLDVVVDGDPGAAARVLARCAPRAAAFALSEEFGGWRVVDRGGGWQIDVERLRGASLEDDLALRDFTVNAIAETLCAGADGTAPGELIDPLGGIGDLAARRLRVAGRGAFAEDPLRVLRLVRIAVELELTPTSETLRAASAHAHELRAVSAERVFAELQRILASPRAIRGLELMGEIGATAIVLPELDTARGVEQNRYHHRDVHGHTLEVLERTIALTDALLDPERVPAPAGVAVPAEAAEPAVPAGAVEPAEVAPAAVGAEGGDDAAAAIAGLGLGSRRAELAALLAEPVGDALTRADALRWGALLHDLAKPLTRAVRPGDGRVTFIGHDVRGAELAGEVLDRLRASQRLRTHVAALVRHHLRAGFLVHEPQPLARRTVFEYLRGCAPVEVDVTLLSIADRLATRGDGAQKAIAAHLAVTRTLLFDALGWHRAGGPPSPLWRGDELARELGIPLGPRVGELLRELSAARYAGEIGDRTEALAHARAKLRGAPRR